MSHCKYYQICFMELYRLISSSRTWVSMALHYLLAFVTFNKVFSFHHPSHSLLCYSFFTQSCLVDYALFPSVLLVSTVSVKISKLSFLIMCTINFSCLLFILNINVHFISILLKPSSLLLMFLTKVFSVSFCKTPFLWRDF